MKIFANVQNLKEATLQAGTITETKGYYSSGDGGQARYLIQTAAEYGGTPDGYGNFEIANGNVAVLQVDGAVNVKQFGATGNGSDDTAAVQAAIDYASTSIQSIGSEITGAVVFVPAGLYLIESNLDIGGNSGVSLLGEGKTKSTFECGESVTRLLDFSSSNNYRGSVSGMRLTGGIGGSSATIAYVYGGGNQIDFVDNWIDSCSVFIDTNGFADCRISGNTFEYVNTLFKGTGYYDTIISENMFYAYGPTSTGSSPFNFVDSYRTQFINNKIVFDRASLGAVNTFNIDGSNDLIISSNTIYDRTGGYPERFMRIDESERIIISNNQFGRSIKDTISINNSSGISVIGNTLIGALQSGFYTMSVSTCSDIIIADNAIANDGEIDYSVFNNGFDLFVTVTERITVSGNVFRKPGYLTNSVVRFKISDDNTCAEPGFVIRRAVLTALPTGKNWEKGDTFTNTTPSPGGYSSYIITQGGTGGTLNGGATTGSITNGSDQLTVSSVDGISVNNYLTIAGVTYNDHYVKSISGLVVTLSEVADATVSGAAVGFSSPVIRGFAAIQ